MASAGSLTVDLTLQCAQFIANASKAAQATQKAATQISASFDLIKKGGQLLAGAFAFDAIVDTGKRALEYASSLDEVSQQLGVTATDLQTFRYAASQVGISQEEMDKGLQKFTKTLGQARAGVSSAVGTFKQLGLSDDQIKNLSNHDALLKAADGIGKIGDAALRSAPEVALFGKTGQQLDTLLSSGSQGINDLTKAASDLGLVLTRDEIENADRTADKLSELKQVLEANIAKFVADNAAAIFNLAEGLEKLTLKGAEFARDANSNFAALGSLFEPMVQGGEKAFDRLGIRITSFHDQILSVLQGIDQLRNIPIDLNNKVAAFDQKHLSGIPGYTPGQIVARSDLAGQFDQSFGEARLKEFLSQNQLEVHGQTKGGGYTDPGAIAAAAAARKKVAEESARAAKEAARNQARFDSELGRGQADILSLNSDLTANLNERNENARQQIEIDRSTKNQTIQLDDKLTAAQKAQLTSLNNQAATLQLRRINYQDELTIDKENVDNAIDRLNASNDILGSQQQLARTARDRQAIELKLLANARAAEEARLKPILDDESRSASNRHYTDAEIASAKKQSAGLDAKYNAQAAVIGKQNQGPLASFLDGIPQTANEINESLQGVATDGLSKLTDGLTAAVTGTGSLRDAFKSLSSSIVADLAKIAIEQAVIKPLANALLGGGSGGGIGGLIGSLFGHRANGGITQPGTYEVGERGPEIMSIGATANIVPNSRINNEGGSSKGLTVNFGNITSNDPAAIKLAAYQAIAENMPLITTNAKNATIAAIRRPSM